MERGKRDLKNQIIDPDSKLKKWHDIFHNIFRAIYFMSWHDSTCLLTNESIHNKMLCVWVWSYVWRTHSPIHTHTHAHAHTHAHTHTRTHTHTQIHGTKTSKFQDWKAPCNFFLEFFRKYLFFYSHSIALPSFFPFSPSLSPSLTAFLLASLHPRTCIWMVCASADPIVEINEWQIWVIYIGDSSDMYVLNISLCHI